MEPEKTLYRGLQLILGHYNIKVGEDDDAYKRIVQEITKELENVWMDEKQKGEARDILKDMDGLEKKLKKKEDETINRLQKEWQLEREDLEAKLEDQQQNMLASLQKLKDGCKKEEDRLQEAQRLWDEELQKKIVEAVEQYRPQRLPADASLLVPPQGSLQDDGWPGRVDPHHTYWQPWRRRSCVLASVGAVSGMSLILAGMYHSSSILLATTLHVFGALVGVTSADFCVEVMCRPRSYDPRSE